MSKRKCGCIYAPPSRSGHEMGGYLQHECEACAATRTAPKPLEPKMVFEKSYDGESICDLSRDISEAFDERFNPAIAGIPEIEHGFHAGSFKVTIEWTKE